MGLGIILIAWLVFFSRTLFFGQLYFLDDLKIFYYPLESEYARFQQQWTLPQWSNVFGFGQPLLAWGQLGFFTPLHVLLRFLGIHPLILLNISVVLYFLIGLMGMFVYVRKIRLSQYAASAAALIFAFGGFSIGHLNHVNFYTSTMLLPWLLLVVESLITKPKIRTSLIVALVASAITLSGQPQVVTLTFLVAFIISFISFLSHIKNSSFNIRSSFITIVFVIFSGLVGLSVSSFAILPLLEFLPSTERAAGLDPLELYEFSYPPWHAITLIFPYFFGNHDSYWGAKGFQELAAFVGIVPLLMSGYALSQWHTQRRTRVAAILLFFVAISVMLGKYSPLYRYLVEEHLLKSVSVPGRFTFLFSIALALLCAVGIDDITSQIKRLRQRIVGILGSFLLMIVLFAPFFLYAPSDIAISQQLQRTTLIFPLSTALAVLGAIAWVLLFLFQPANTSDKPDPKHVNVLNDSYIQKNNRPLIIPTCTVAIIAITLLSFGWNYNPLTDKEKALVKSPFEDSLMSYQKTNGTPPRLYSNEKLLQDGYESTVITSSEITPTLSVYQPIAISRREPLCFILPLSSSFRKDGNVTLGLHTDLLSDPLSEITIDASLVEPDSEEAYCFTNIPQLPSEEVFLSVRSQYQSGVYVRLADTPNSLSAYLVRVQQPTERQLVASQKHVRLAIDQLVENKIDRDLVILSRHLNAITNTSSARFIGALGIRPYREFIERMYANDGEVIGGDGLHVLERNRDLFNLAGVTHFIQLIKPGTNDRMNQAGFSIVETYKDSAGEFRLYENPNAYPKAFLIPKAIWKPGIDEVVYELRENNLDPTKIALLDGPIPPNNFPSGETISPTSSATITLYEPTRADVTITTDKDTVLVLSDTWTPQWQVLIDNKPSLSFSAFAVFRAAIVPAGTHTVSFRYDSPAVEKSKNITIAGITLVTALYVISSPRVRKFLHFQRGG